MKSDSEIEFSLRDSYENPKFFQKLEIVIAFESKWAYSPLLMVVQLRDAGLSRKSIINGIRQ